MSNPGDFSEEQSEDLISHLKVGGHSEFEQLRSALNLLSHVTELPPTALPPVLPSGITQPIPLLPVNSTKPRRTIITSAIVVGMFASASLAAAAVTGIGPAPIVNIGHQTAKLVKGFAGAVSNVVTGGSEVTTESETIAPRIPGMTPAPTAGDDSSPQSGSGESSNNNEGSGDDSLSVTIPSIVSVHTPETKPSSDGKEGKSGSGQESKSGSGQESKSGSGQESKSGSGQESPSTSNEDQSSNSEDSHSLIIGVLPTPTSSASGGKEHTESETHNAPKSSTTALPTALPTTNESEQSSDDD